MMRKSNFLESELTLSLRQTASGDLQLPASKSISLRAMLLASLGKEILPEILSQVIGNPNHSEKTLPPAYAKQGKTTDRVPTEGR